MIPLESLQPLSIWLSLSNLPFSSSALPWWNDTFRNREAAPGLLKSDLLMNTCVAAHKLHPSHYPCICLANVTNTNEIIITPMAYWLMALFILTSAFASPSVLLSLDPVPIPRSVKTHGLSNPTSLWLWPFLAFGSSWALAPHLGQWNLQPWLYLLLRASGPLFFWALKTLFSTWANWDLLTYT